MWLRDDALTAIWSNIGDDSLMHMADITVRYKCLVLRAVGEARSSVFNKSRDTSADARVFCSRIPPACSVYATVRE